MRDYTSTPLFIHLHISTVRSDAWVQTHIRIIPWAAKQIHPDRHRRSLHMGPNPLDARRRGRGQGRGGAAPRARCEGAVAVPTLGNKPPLSFIFLKARELAGILPTFQ